MSSPKSTRHTRQKELDSKHKCGYTLEKANFFPTHFCSQRGGRSETNPIFDVLRAAHVNSNISTIVTILACHDQVHPQTTVYSSNMLAIPGLRALYTCCWRVKTLQMGLGLVLAFVGVKMLAAKWHVGCPL